jgi:YfiH family protein
MGGLVGDDPTRVEQNRLLAFDIVGRDPDSMYDVWQVHGNEVVLVDKPRPKMQSHLKADAIITNNPSVTLFMRFADCVPILLFDPVTNVIGIAHAGWQGTIKKIALRTVQLMSQTYGCHPTSIRAGIGPSICVEHYEVGPEIYEQVQNSFGDDRNLIMLEQNRKFYFDLWKSNHRLLQQAGLKYIEVAGICTYSNLDDWFSHRGEQGKTGRFGALIGLKV